MGPLLAWLLRIFLKKLFCFQNHKLKSRTTWANVEAILVFLRAISLTESGQRKDENRRWLLKRAILVYRAVCFSLWSHFSSPREQMSCIHCRGLQWGQNILCSHKVPSICWAALCPQLPAVKMNSLCSRQLISSAFISLYTDEKLVP